MMIDLINCLKNNKLTNVNINLCEKINNKTKSKRNNKHKRFHSINSKIIVDSKCIKNNNLNQKLSEKNKPK